MTLVQVDFPSRVTIAMQIDPGDLQNGGSDSRIHFDFIWGIGLGGLTDFELALSRVAKGDAVSLTFGSAAAHGMFEHLVSHVLSLCKSDDAIRVTAWIEKIEPVTNHEVVKAMAGLKERGCGCGGEGGCGCH